MGLSPRWGGDWREVADERWRRGQRRRRIQQQRKQEQQQQVVQGER